LLLVFVSYIIFILYTHAKQQFKIKKKYKRYVYHLLIFVGIINLILLPFVMPALFQLTNGDYDVKSKDYHTLIYSSADLCSYFVPDTTQLAEWRGWAFFKVGEKFKILFNENLSGNLAEKSVYPGWISWLAFIAAITIKGIRKKGMPWIIMFTGFFILTLGPALLICGEQYFVGLLPFRLLSSIPIFDIIRGPSRFALFVPLGAGILLAMELKWIRMKKLKKTYLLLSLLIPLITTFEFLPEPVKIYPKELFVSEFYKNIQDEPPDYSVLNIPADFAGARGGADLYKYLQIIHQKPIISGYVSREPKYVFETLNKYHFIQAVVHHEYEKDRKLRLTGKGLSDMDKTLKELNIGYIILHKIFFDPAEWQRLLSWIGDRLGKPVFNDKWVLVYSSPYK